MILRLRTFNILATSLLTVDFTNSFTPSSSNPLIRPTENAKTLRQTTIFSTPFDLGMYDDNKLDASSNPFQPEDDDDSSPLAVDPSTKLVLGINKYSHDTTLCAANAATGEVLFALSKERITRKKHDGGNTASLVELCLDTLELDIDAIEKVVMNNHHHRILPFVESNPNHMEWEEGLGINGGTEDGYSDEYNLLSSVKDKMELSHHLAHAYSAAAQCPFDEGMIVVMDGMGETFRTMKKAEEMKDETYVSDFTLCKKSGHRIEFVPKDVEEIVKTSYFDWREAESVYTFQKDKTHLVIKVSYESDILCRIYFPLESHVYLFTTTPHQPSQSSRDSQKKIPHQHFTTTVSKIWILLELSIPAPPLISLEIGMPAER